MSEIKTFRKHNRPKASTDDLTFSVDVFICFDEKLLCVGCFDFENDGWLFHSDTLTDRTDEDFSWMYAPEELLKFLSPVSPYSEEPKGNIIMDSRKAT